MTTEEQVLFDKCVGFLQTIGIPVVFARLEGDCFLPGFQLNGGEVVIDIEKMRYPGDLLHEAAHIAIVPAAERGTLTADSIMLRPMREAEEMMAIAWTYAACVHLGIHPYFVLHKEGYQGGGNEIADNFMEGRYFGVPMLQWVGMCAANGSAEPQYPAMLHWLRGDR
jgi:hypothetical protein